ncbi:MAG: hypothetical protein NXI28_15280 [bacterium]|nr:hypothetical protein [bacterium]
MITTSPETKRTAPLYSLADLHRRRTSMVRQRDRSIAAENAHNGEQTESTVSLEALAQMDAVFKVALRLKQDRSPDAVHIARGLLHALLRLACCKAQKKPKANPEPAAVPLKLLSAGVIDKPTMRRFRKAIEAGSVGDVLACCRELFAWLSAEPDAKIESEVSQ